MADIKKDAVFESGNFELKLIASEITKEKISKNSEENNFEGYSPIIEAYSDGTLANTNEIYLNLDCVDEAVLEEAYQHCRRITRKGSKTFYFGSLLLPYQKRRAMWAFYSFCRYTDDLVDNSESLTSDELVEQLDYWETESRAALQGQVNARLSHFLAWSHSVTNFQIPPEPTLELIEGCRMDLTKSRYANFDELRLYCYRVASTVGLVAAQVIGYSDPIALNYAIDLGIAMQLTNILRDVGEDARNGRIYLPLDEMRQFGYTEEELLQGVINQSFIQLMKFQIERARRYYQQAMPGIEYLTADSRLSISVAADLYSRILDVIERNNYDVFTRRAYVPGKEKLARLLVNWRKRHFSFRRASKGIAEKI